MANNNQLCLGDIVSIQRGTTYKSMLLGQKGPVLLGLATIQRNGGFRSDSMKTYGGESPEKITLRPGDLYVSLKDVTQAGDLLGAIARVPQDIPAGRLTQDTVKLIFKNPKISQHYIYWLLRTPQYRDYCRLHATGTTNLGLSREDFLAFPVPEPTRSLSETIDLLEAIEQKMDINRRMNETLEQLARALFKSWFVDFDPVRAKAEGRDPDLPAEIAGLFPDSFEQSSLGEIPSGWRVTKFSEQIEAVKGLSYKGEFLSKESGIPMHNLNSIYEGGGYKHEGIKYYTGEYKEQHIIKPGDIIVANTEQGFHYLLIGYPAIVPQVLSKGIYSHHIFRVRPLQESGIKIHFLYLLLMVPSVREQIIACTNGTTVNMMSLDGLRNPVFSLPPTPLINHFEAFALPIFQKMEENITEIKNLIQIRNLLLPKLFERDIS